MKRSKLIKSNTGLTLIEALVSMLIGAIVLGSLLEGFVAFRNLSQMNQETSIALDDLSDMMEHITQTPFNDIIDNFPDGVANGDGSINYSDITGTYSLDNEQITVTYTDVAVDPLEIIVTLTWTDSRNNTRSLSLSTYRTE